MNERQSVIDERTLGYNRCLSNPYSRIRKIPPGEKKVVWDSEEKIGYTFNLLSNKESWVIIIYRNK